MGIRRKMQAGIIVMGMMIMIENSSAFNAKNKYKEAMKLLGTKKVKAAKVKYGKAEAFRAKGKVVFLETGIYEPDCHHSFLVGIHCKSRKVVKVVPIDGSCPHIFPAYRNSFLSQFKGIRSAKSKKLKNVQTVAGATGSSIIIRDAVKRSLRNAKTACGK